MIDLFLSIFFTLQHPQHHQFLTRNLGFCSPHELFRLIWFGEGLFGWMAATLMVVAMRRVGCEGTEETSLTSQRPQLLVTCIFLEYTNGNNNEQGIRLNIGQVKTVESVLKNKC